MQLLEILSHVVSLLGLQTYFFNHLFRLASRGKRLIRESVEIHLKEGALNREWDFHLGSLWLSALNLIRPR